MALVLTIGGVTKTLKDRSLRISQTANGRATASFKVVSTDASFRPVIDTEVLFVEDGTRIFGGLVQRPEEVGAGAHAGITTTINAVDFTAYADRRAVNGTMPAGTMLSHLSIIQIYLAAFGVTLDGGQVTGPAMPALIHEYVRASDVLNEIARLTSDAGEPFVWRIDEFKVLSMYQPSTVPAPFDVLTDTPPEVVGDIEVLSTREHYANSIIVLVPSRSEINRIETFTGDGTTTSFPLNYHLDANPAGYVTSNGANETFSIGGGGTWDYDPVTNAITRTSAPAAGAPISIQFNGTLATFGLASDAGEIAAVGHWEKVFRVESVPNAATAQAIAVAELANALALHTTVRYRTTEPLIRPGQTQTITVPRRNVDATGMVGDVVISDLGSQQLLNRDVTVVVDSTQSNLRRNWRDVYKKWSDDTTGRGNTVVSGTNTVPPTAPPGGGNPAPPVLSVQWNNTGVFGGDIAFTYNTTTNSLVCGGGGSSITAAAPESCQVFGYNCHITD